MLNLLPRHPGLGSVLAASVSDLKRPQSAESKMPTLIMLIPSCPK